MKILFLTQIIPYPPDAGPKVKTWHVLRYLVEHGHQVTLASFIRPEEQAYVERLRRLCRAVYTVPIRRSRLADMFYWVRSNLTGRPFLIERDDVTAMRDLITNILSKDAIDVIHADQLTMTQFALPAQHKHRVQIHDGGSANSAGPVLVFDAHNAVWTILDRMREAAPWLLRPILALEARRVKRYEGEVVKSYDHTLAVTQLDKSHLLEAVRISANGAQPENTPISIIPIAVDTAALQPIERKAGSLNILTLGTLHYPPNADGIRWFLREVFPLIRAQVPEATLTIIGKNPPKDFIQLRNTNRDHIEVTGYVPDLKPYLEKAALMVVPVRAGGGMRVRILEAFAYGMPLITTTVGLEGIAATPNVDVMVADAPKDFAGCVTNLLEDQQLQLELSNNGRSLAKRLYDWKVVLQGLEQVYLDLDKKTVGQQYRDQE